MCDTKTFEAAARKHNKLKITSQHTKRERERILHTFENNRIINHFTNKIKFKQTVTGQDAYTEKEVPPVKVAETISRVNTAIISAISKLDYKNTKE